MRQNTAARACMAVILGFCISASQAEPPSIDGRIDFREWMLLPKVGLAGCVALPANQITHSIVMGTFQPPKEGDTVPLGVGKQAVWTAVRAPEAGPLQHELLLGGWAYAKITSDGPRRAILRAKGHSIAYVRRMENGLGFWIVAF